MRWTEAVRRIPQPLKTLGPVAVLGLIPFAVGVVTQPASQEGAGRLLFLPFPVTFAVIGLVLALDVRGNATAYWELLKEQPFSTFGSLVFVRLLGAGCAVVGIVMAGAAALGRG